MSEKLSIEEEAKAVKTLAVLEIAARMPEFLDNKDFMFGVCVGIIITMRRWMQVVPPELKDEISKHLTEKLFKRQEEKEKEKEHKQSEQ